MWRLQAPSRRRRSRHSQLAQVHPASRRHKIPCESLSSHSRATWVPCTACNLTAERPCSPLSHCKALRALQPAHHTNMPRVAAILLLAAAVLLAAGPAAAARKRPPGERGRKLLTCPSTSGCQNWGFPFNSASTAQLGDPGKDCGSASVSSSLPPLWPAPQSARVEPGPLLPEQLLPGGEQRLFLTYATSPAPRSSCCCRTTAAAAAPSLRGTAGRPRARPPGPTRGERLGEQLGAGAGARRC